MSLFGKLSQTEEEVETKVDIQTGVTGRHKCIYTKTVFQMEQVRRDGNEEHKVEYHKEHMGRNEE